MYHTAIKHDVYLRTGEKCKKKKKKKNAQVGVYYISRALFLFFFLYSDITHSAKREGIAYATKSCEISQGLELKNPSVWQEESAVAPAFFLSTFARLKQRTSESNNPQMLLLPKVTRVVYESHDEEET